MSPTPTLPPAVHEVLFVCTGNSCRSVMAEFIFRKLAGEKGLSVHAHSAGIAAAHGSGASFETLEVLKRDGMDARPHSSRMVHEGSMDSADMILALTEEHATHLRKHFPEDEPKIYLLTEFYTGPERAQYVHGVPDPIGLSSDVYRTTYSVIKSCVQNLVNQLAARK